jgi:uncharacterized membrane protein HdeD (DUF308 family)
VSDHLSFHFEWLHATVALRELEAMASLFSRVGLIQRAARPSQLPTGSGRQPLEGCGWAMLSGAFGVLAGLVTLSGFLMTGLWVLGFVLGVDLISHGIAWLTYAWQPAAGAAWRK